MLPALSPGHRSGGFAPFMSGITRCGARQVFSLDIARRESISPEDLPCGFSQPEMNVATANYKGSRDVSRRRRGIAIVLPRQRSAKFTANCGYVLIYDGPRKKHRR